MSELRELYQELILEHARQPRNFGKLENANHIKEGFNPLCGDKITIYIHEENEIIVNVNFDGVGCAISMASASLMTEVLKGRNYTEAEALFKTFHQLVTGQVTGPLGLSLGKLNAFAGVAQYPSRVKCASLSWHTMHAVIQNCDACVTTE